MTSSIEDLADRLFHLTQPAAIFRIGADCKAAGERLSNPAAMMIGDRLVELGHILDGEPLTVADWDRVQALAERFSEILRHNLACEAVIEAWSRFRSKPG